MLKPLLNWKSLCNVSTIKCILPVIVLRKEELAENSSLRAIFSTTLNAEWRLPYLRPSPLAENDQSIPSDRHLSNLTFGVENENSRRKKNINLLIGCHHCFPFDLPSKKCKVNECGCSIINCHLFLQFSDLESQSGNENAKVQAKAFQKACHLLSSYFIAECHSYNGQSCYFAGSSKHLIQTPHR